MANMKISKLMADDAILLEVGGRIARSRVDQQLTQAELAEQAGVSKRTVERVESGASVQFTTIIRILRVLELLQGVEGMVAEPVARPMELLKNSGKQRRRASSTGRVKEQAEPWSWGDES